MLSAVLPRSRPGNLRMAHITSQTASTRMTAQKRRYTMNANGNKKWPINDTPHPPSGWRRLQPAGWDFGAAIVRFGLDLRRALCLGLGGSGSFGDLAVGRVEHGVHLPAFNRLFCLEIFGQLHELVAALGQNLPGTLIACIDQPVDFLVDLPGDLLAVVSLLAEVAAEEDELLLVAERERAQLVGHAPLGHHAAGENGRLINKVAEVGAGKAGGLAGEDFEVDLAIEGLVARVHFEDGATAADVRPIERHMPVEPTGAEQRRIENVRAVGGRDHDHMGVGLEAVHLDQQLVERLLALVVTAAQAGAALASDGVDLIDKDDAGRVLLRLIEEVAHSRGAYADEHLDEFRAGDAEEGDARFARDRFAQQRLPGPR